MLKNVKIDFSSDGDKLLSNTPQKNFVRTFFSYIQNFNKEKKNSSTYKASTRQKFRLDKALRNLNRQDYCKLISKEELLVARLKLKETMESEDFYQKAREYHQYINQDSKLLEKIKASGLYKQVIDSVPKWVLKWIADNFKNREVDYKKLSAVFILLFIQFWLTPLLWIKELFGANKYLSWTSPDIGPELNLEFYNTHICQNEEVKDRKVLQTNNSDIWLDDTIPSVQDTIILTHMTNDQIKELAQSYEKEWKYLEAYPIRLELAENRYKNPQSDDEIYLQAKYFYYSGRTYAKWTSYMGAVDAYAHYQKSLENLSKLIPVSEITEIDKTAILTIQVLEDCANTQRELARNEQNPDAKRDGFESTVELLTQALNLNKLDPDWAIYVAKDHNDIWEIYFLMEEYQLALQEYQKSIDIKIEIKDSKLSRWKSIVSIEKSLATSYLNAWKSYIKLWEMELAKVYLVNAYWLKEKHIASIAECLCALWEWNEASLDFDNAKKYYQIAYGHAIAQNWTEVEWNIANGYDIWTEENLKMENNLVVALDVAYKMLNLLKNIESDWDQIQEYEMRAMRVIHLMKWINTQQKGYYGNITELNKDLQDKQLYIISTKNDLKNEKIISEQTQARLAIQKSLNIETEKLFQAEEKRKNELANKLEIEKKLNDQKDVLLTTQKDKLIAEANAKKFLTLGVAISSIFLSIAIFFALSFNKKKKKEEELNKKLEAANTKLFLKKKVAETAKATAEIAKAELESSIKYASNISKWLLPDTEVFDKIFPDKNFIIFNPSNIVSGDYYWFMEREHDWDQEVHLVAWDCTGHGVPWWFLSTMMGTRHSANMTLNNLKDISPDQSLNMQRDFVVKVFSQDVDAIDSVKDWADLVYVLLNKTNMTLEMAWAYNSVFVLRKWEFEDPKVTHIWDDWEIVKTTTPDIKGKSAWFKRYKIKWQEDYTLIELKWDRMPVWIHIKKSPNFTKKILNIQKLDKVYMFGDGLQDQFGWEENTKFLIKNLRDLIVNSQNLSMKEQGLFINKAIRQWQWKKKQTDDQVMIAFQVW